MIIDSIDDVKDLLLDGTNQILQKADRQAKREIEHDFVDEFTNKVDEFDFSKGFKPWHDALEEVADKFLDNLEEVRDKVSESCERVVEGIKEDYALDQDEDDEMDPEDVDYEEALKWYGPEKAFQYFMEEWHHNLQNAHEFMKYIDINSRKFNFQEVVSRGGDAEWAFDDILLHPLETEIELLYKYIEDALNKLENEYQPEIIVSIFEGTSVDFKI
jgi:uncharacterized protein YqgV (UPF0045/DUF77 family)